MIQRPDEMEEAADLYTRFLISTRHTDAKWLLDTTVFGAIYLSHLLFSPTMHCIPA